MEQVSCRRARTQAGGQPVVQCCRRACGWIIPEHRRSPKRNGHRHERSRGSAQEPLFPRIPPGVLPCTCNEMKAPPGPDARTGSSPEMPGDEMIVARDCESAASCCGSMVERYLNPTPESCHPKNHREQLNYHIPQQIGTEE